MKNIWFLWAKGVKSAVYCHLHNGRPKLIFGLQFKCLADLNIFRDWEKRIAFDFRHMVDGRKQYLCGLENLNARYGEKIIWIKLIQSVYYD